MKILFFGTPEFSIPSLKKILEEKHEVIGVVTQPDKPKGRSLKPVPPPVKVLAVERGLRVLQPRSLKKEDFLETVRALQPEAIAVVAYGKILPKSLLDLFPERVINIHPSLLPAYRGGAPIQWALIRGEVKTGVTSIFMDPGMDTGKVLLSSEVPIDPEDDASTLAARLSAVGAEVLAETLRGLERGDLHPAAQDESRATLAPLLKKEDGYVDWSRPSEAIHNLRRGLAQWPGAQAFMGGRHMLLGKTHSAPSDPAAPEPPGTVLGLSGDSLLVRCGGGTALRIDALKPEGRRFLNGRELVNGRHLRTGDRFERPPAAPADAAPKP
jgi:methionyl-tRNA formyltransferase